MLCPDYANPSFLFFIDYVPRIVYYSHLPAMLTALWVGIFVLIRSEFSLAGKKLFAMTLTFSLWTLTNLFAWASNNILWIIFLWTFFSVLYVLIYYFSLEFIYAFIHQKGLLFKQKITALILMLPILYFASTTFNISGFDASNCEATFPLSKVFDRYYYFLGLFFFFWIIWTVFWGWKKAEERMKKQILILGASVGFFLLAFFVTGYLASYLGDWYLEQYGLFGMVFFLGALAYLMVKFSAFNVKLAGAQALASIIVVLIGAQFAFIRTPMNRWLNGITFVLALVFGWILVRSVKKEIKTREEIELVSEKLAAAYAKLKKLDNAKTEFISIASHQLRTPLTSIKGFMSMVMGGDYGQVPKAFVSPLEKIYVSNERLIKLVEDLLNISRIETGRLVFAFNQNDAGKITQEVFDTMFIVAKNRNLKLEYDPPKTVIAPFMFDSVKIREVFSNLVDNALKYTKQGWVRISLTETDEKVVFCVADSGMGIAKDELQYIFEKFQRGQEAGTVQSEGTGLGLYVCQKIVDAHKGRIWVESNGVGQGSQFYVELDKRFVPTKNS